MTGLVGWLVGWVVWLVADCGCTPKQTQTATEVDALLDLSLLTTGVASDADCQIKSFLVWQKSHVFSMYSVFMVGWGCIGLALWLIVFLGLVYCRFCLKNVLMDVSGC